MSQLKVDDIVDSAGTGPVGFSQGANVASAQSTGIDGDVTLTTASNYVQKVTPTADRVYTLPSTGVKAGTVYRIMNQAAIASGFEITIDAADSSAIYVVSPQGHGDVQALVNDPADSGDWLVLGSSSKKWQTKLLTANVTATQTATDLSCTTVVGKTYMLMGVWRYSGNSATDDISIEVKDGSTVIGEYGNNNGINNITVRDGWSLIYTATDTALTVDVTEVGAISLVGNNTREQTYLQIMELPGSVETVEF